MEMTELIPHFGSASVKPSKGIDHIRYYAHLGNVVYADDVRTARDRGSEVAAVPSNLESGLS